MRHRTRIVAFGALMCLAGCGSSATDNGAANSESARAATGGAGGWNATNACAALSKEDAAAAIGVPVASAKLGTVVEGTDASAAFSMCDYDFDNGAKLSLLTREAPSPDASASAIEAARTAGGTMEPAVDVPGIGKAALWSDKLKGLQVFLDDTRYVSINLFGLPAGADAKAMSIEVAKKLS